MRTHKHRSREYYELKRERQRAFKKKKRNQRKRTARELGKITRHHLTPRSRGGKSNTWNILRFWQKRHEAWHMLFQNLTLEEIIQEIREMSISIKPEDFFKLLDGKRKKWRLLFPDFSLKRTAAILNRLARAKGRNEYPQPPTK